MGADTPLATSAWQALNEKMVVNPENQQKYNDGSFNWSW